MCSRKYKTSKYEQNFLGLGIKRKTFIKEHKSLWQTDTKVDAIIFTLSMDTLVQSLSLDEVDGLSFLGEHYIKLSC